MRTAAPLQELTAAKCLEIFKRIPDEDCKALGFDCVYTRPDWMIISNMPVPPPHVRPSVMMDSSARYACMHAAHAVIFLMPCNGMHACAMMGGSVRYGYAFGASMA